MIDFTQWVTHNFHTCNCSKCISYREVFTSINKPKLVSINTKKAKTRKKK